MKNNSLLVSALLFIACVTDIYASDPIQRIGWTKIHNIDTPAAIKQETGSQNALPVLSIEGPEITQRNHAIGGELRYSNVKEPGFVEMWTHYDGGGRYFSRTLGESGPMAKLSGASEWRPFLLPFFSDGKKPPAKLAVNLMLPGGGDVEFRNVGLYQLPGDRMEAPSPLDRAWWDASFAAKLGAVGGVLMGFAGAIFGTLAANGKGRRFVLISMGGFIAVGAILAICGVIAIFAGQPYAVWFSLLQLGGILVVVNGCLIPFIRKTYLNHELRVISAAG